MVDRKFREFVRRLRHKPAALLALVGIGLAGLSDTNSAAAANGSATYAYDALGRVASVTYDSGAIVYYTYDANGNRLSQVVNVNTTALIWTATSSPCTVNCWGAALWHP